MINEDDKKFLALLFAMYDKAGVELTEPTIDSYLNGVSDKPMSSVNLAMKELLDNQHLKGRIPTVNDILEKTDQESNISVKGAATEAVDQVIRAFKRHGIYYTNYTPNSYYPYDNYEDDFKSKFGEVALNLVKKMGGYDYLFNDWSNSKNHEWFKSQLKESAMIMLEKAKLGIEGHLAMPAPKDHKMIGKGSDKVNAVIRSLTAKVSVNDQVDKEEEAKAKDTISH